MDDTAAAISAGVDADFIDDDFPATTMITTDRTTTTTTTTTVQEQEQEQIIDSMNSYSTFSFSSMSIDDILKSDRTFLLRCSSTYNWDVLLEFVSVIQDIISSSIRDRDVISHQNRLFAIRQQFITTDQWGNTVLHQACYNSPPSCVIEILLSVSEQIGSVIMTTTKKKTSSEFDVITLTHYLTKDLSTPLNVACGIGADLDILELLLSSLSSSNDGNDTRRRDVSNGGHVGGGSSMVTVPDSRGCTPLSELTINYELQRKSTRYRSLHALPLDEVGRRRPGRQSITTGTGGDQSQQQQQQHEGQGGDPNNEVLATFWAKTEALIRASWVSQVNEMENDDYNDTSFPNNCSSSTYSFQRLLRQSSWISLVHGAALGECADSCPPILTKCITRTYPAMVAFSNRHGIFPIHCATITSIRIHPHEYHNCQFYNPKKQQQQQQQQLSCSPKKYNDHENDDHDDEEEDDDSYDEATATIFIVSLQRRTAWIETLVELYPPAVQRNFPHNHRSVFCQALASGLTWHIPLTGHHHHYHYQQQQSNKIYNCNNNNNNVVVDDDDTNTGWANFSTMAHDSSLLTNNHMNSSQSCLPTVDATNNHDNDSKDNLQQQQEQQQRQQQRGPIQLLYNYASPSILSTRDVVTGLYPFALAALRRNETNDTTRRIKGTRRRKRTTGPKTASMISLFQLDTIYSLLRLHPQLVQEALV